MKLLIIKIKSTKISKNLMKIKKLFSKTSIKNSKMLIQIYQKDTTLNLKISKKKLIIE
jgi:hypothetical protein